jgi:transposase
VVIEMDYSSKSVDHLGIVAGVCKEIDLVNTIDSIIGVNNLQKVTTGEAVMAMVINALGFVSKPLYMFTEFMEKKPVKLLFENGLEPEDFNDDTLGRALDRVFENGTTKIFMKVSFNALKQIGVKRNYFHLDTTSISVHGEYENSEENMIPIEITHGKSKDGRDDLKQYIISLITVSESDLPVWIDALSGNTSDKTHFREVVKEYSSMLKENDEEAYFIMDSAMYSDKNVREMSGLIKWISRVPESMMLAKDLLIKTDKENMEDMKKYDLEGYYTKSFSRTYANVEQKWVLIFSEKGYERENKTLNKNISKEEVKVRKQVWHFGNDEFACKDDALKALKEKEKKWKYHRVDGYNIINKRKTGRRGRPKKNSEDGNVVYQIKPTFKKDREAIEKDRKRKGKFIIATNAIHLDPDGILREYLGQQGVERGFRFIKDPLFFTDSTFLKKPQRIVSLVMIMGLGLLVYSLAQSKLRMVLKDMKETVPDQKGKPTDKPTMRWIFQKFEGIELLIINDSGKITQKMLNMKPVHKKILALMGEKYEKIYFLERGCGT